MTQAGQSGQAPPPAGSGKSRRSLLPREAVWSGGWIAREDCAGFLSGRQAIGAGAVNQAIKAAAIARGYLLLDGINVVVIPSFGEVDIEGAERTAVRFSVEPR